MNDTPLAGTLFRASLLTFGQDLTPHFYAQMLRRRAHALLGEPVPPPDLMAYNARGRANFVLVESLLERRVAMHMEDLGMGDPRSVAATLRAVADDITQPKAEVETVPSVETTLDAIIQNGAVVMPAAVVQMPLGNGYHLKLLAPAAGTYDRVRAGVCYGGAPVDLSGCGRKQMFVQADALELRIMEAHARIHMGGAW